MDPLTFQEDVEQRRRMLPMALGGLQSPQGVLTNTVQPGRALPMSMRARLAKVGQELDAIDTGDVDTSALQAFAKRQGESGQAAMLNALAAQYAGENFQPVQAQFLKQAMAASEPMKLGQGMLTPDGQYIKDPFAARDVRRASLERQYGQLATQIDAQQRYDESRQDRLDRLARDEALRREMMQNNLRQQQTSNQLRQQQLDMQREGLDLRRLIAGVDDPAAQPMPSAGGAAGPAKPGFYETAPPKLNEGQGKARTQASGMAQHIPEMEAALSSGYRPSRTDLLAVGPDLAGMGGVAQKFVPRSRGTAEGVKFMTAGRKVLSLLLRGESGGAITSDEWTSYGPMYLPWPGDDDAEIERKIKDLRRYANDVAFMAGPSAKRWSGFDVDSPVFKPRDNNDGVVDLTPKPR